MRQTQEFWGGGQGLLGRGAQLHVNAPRGARTCCYFARRMQRPTDANENGMHEGVLAPPHARIAGRRAARRARRILLSSIEDRSIGSPTDVASRLPAVPAPQSLVLRGLLPAGPQRPPRSGRGAGRSLANP